MQRKAQGFGSVGRRFGRHFGRPKDGPTLTFFSPTWASFKSSEENPITLSATLSLSLSLFLSLTLIQAHTHTQTHTHKHSHARTRTQLLHAVTEADALFLRLLLNHFKSI